jgi:hypothetical protein
MKGLFIGNKNDLDYLQEIANKSDLELAIDYCPSINEDITLHHYDVAFLDHTTMLKVKNEVKLSVPIVVIIDNHKAGLHAFSKGAHDCLVGGQFSPETLTHCLEFARERMEARDDEPMLLLSSIKKKLEKVDRVLSEACRHRHCG